MLGSYCQIIASECSHMLTGVRLLGAIIDGWGVAVLTSVKPLPHLPQSAGKRKPEGPEQALLCEWKRERSSAHMMEIDESQKQNSCSRRWSFPSRAPDLSHHAALPGPDLHYTMLFCVIIIHTCVPSCNPHRRPALPPLPYLPVGWRLCPSLRLGSPHSRATGVCYMALLRETSQSVNHTICINAIVTQSYLLLWTISATQIFQNNLFQTAQSEQNCLWMGFSISHPSFIHWPDHLHNCPTNQANGLYPDSCHWSKAFAQNEARHILLHENTVHSYHCYYYCI